MMPDGLASANRSSASPLGRRAFRASLMALCLAAAGAPSVAASAHAVSVDPKAKAIAEEKPPVLSLKDALLHDAASPVIGNPEGDVTIVAFVDYNSPECRKSEADLEALIAADPKIRVIYKDLPVMAESSVRAAKVAIAAAWQGKYADIHKALIRIDTKPATDLDIDRAVMASGVDRKRLNKDLDKRVNEIVALLSRNRQEADALQLKGMPIYLIGPFITASPLDLPQFKKIVADAREDQAKDPPKN